MTHGSAYAVATTLAAPAATAAVPSEPDFNALAASFGALGSAVGMESAAIVIVALIVTVLTIVVGISWSTLVAADARKEASEAATQCIRIWLNDEAPAIVRTHVEFIFAQSPAAPPPPRGADEMGEEA